MLSTAAVHFCAPGWFQSCRAVFVGLEIFTPLHFTLKIEFCLPLSTLPLLCASVESCLFFKHALLFEAAEILVAHFMMLSMGQILTGILLLYKAWGKVAAFPGKLGEAGRKTVLFFLLL